MATIAEAVKGAMTEATGTDADVDLKPSDDKNDAVVDADVKETDKSKIEPAAEEDDDTFEIDADETEIKNALSLYRSIVDPQTRPNVIAQLAERSGYDLKQPKQVQQFTEDLTAIIKEGLGDQYDLLSGDRLEKILNGYGEVINKRIEKSLKPLTDKVQKYEMDLQAQAANAALSSLWNRHNIPAGDRPKISDAMTKKMKLIAPGDASVDEYLDDIYTLVQRDAEKARAVKTTVRKITENAKDVNRTSGDGGSDTGRIKTGSRLPSIHESVSAAFRGEKLEE